MKRAYQAANRVICVGRFWKRRERWRFVKDCKVTRGGRSPDEGDGNGRNADQVNAVDVHGFNVVVVVSLEVRQVGAEVLLVGAEVQLVEVEVLLVKEDLDLEEKEEQIKWMVKMMVNNMLDQFICIHGRAVHWPSETR